MAYLIRPRVSYVSKMLSRIILLAAQVSVRPASIALVSGLLIWHCKLRRKHFNYLGIAERGIDNRIDFWSVLLQLCRLNCGIEASVYHILEFR
ncbi:hypothetical protein CC78DRAFT_379182 [Lojkania enalia]|uniref:Uncharacterized protein n=1 Tax=Lojkania enalia TaxID=147567 RepID=A0A9P4KHC3_9PLEO|nr:hypothetical protein CC78DRAFT_379182 [Didymosphaeria enalia]